MVCPILFLQMPTYVARNCKGNWVPIHTRKKVVSMADTVPMTDVPVLAVLSVGCDWLGESVFCLVGSLMGGSSCCTSAPSVEWKQRPPKKSGLWLHLSKGSLIRYHTSCEQVCKSTSFANDIHCWGTPFITYQTGENLLKQGGTTYSPYTQISFKMFCYGVPDLYIWSTCSITEMCWFSLLPTFVFGLLLGKYDFLFHFAAVGLAALWGGAVIDLWLGLGKLGLVQQVVYLAVQQSPLGLYFFGQQHRPLRGRTLLLLSYCVVLPHLWKRGRYWRLKLKNKRLQTMALKVKHFHRLFWTTSSQIWAIMVNQNNIIDKWAE